MNHEEKRAELISLFRDKLRELTLSAKDADEDEKEVIELAMQKVTFNLLLLEDGQTVLNDEKIELTDSRIDMMYRFYSENPI